MSLEVITQLTDVEMIGQTFFWIFGTFVLGVGLLESLYKAKLINKLSNWLKRPGIKGDLNE